MKSSAMKRVPEGTPKTPDRGPLLTDEDVARFLKLGNPESLNVRRWVRANVPNKRRIGHNTVRWFQADVIDWVASTGDK